MTTVHIPDDIKPGFSLRIWYGENHPANRLLHIRAIVDEEIIVCRQWSRRKNRWLYYAEDIIYFEAADALGLLRGK